MPEPEKRKKVDLDKIWEEQWAKAEKTIGGRRTAPEAKFAPPAPSAFIPPTELGEPFAGAPQPPLGRQFFDIEDLDTGRPRTLTIDKENIVFDERDLPLARYDPKTGEFFEIPVDTPLWFDILRKGWIEPTAKVVEKLPAILEKMREPTEIVTAIGTTPPSTVVFEQGIGKFEASPEGQIVVKGLAEILQSENPKEELLSQYRKYPEYQRVIAELLIEAPIFAVLPTAGALRADLALTAAQKTVRGVVARVVSGGLVPFEALEKAPLKVLRAITRKGAKPPAVKPPIVAEKPPVTPKVEPIIPEIKPAVRPKTGVGEVLVWDVQAKRFVVTKGQPIKIEGFEKYDFVVARPLGAYGEPTTSYWSVSEATTGMLISDGSFPTRQKAIESASARLAKVGEEQLKFAMEAELSMRRPPEVPVPPPIKPVTPEVKPPLYKAPIIIETEARKLEIQETDALIKEMATLFRGRKVARPVIEAIKKEVRGVRGRKLGDIAQTAKTLDELVSKGYQALKGKFAEPPIYEPIVLAQRKKDLLLRYIVDFPFEQLEKHPDYARWNMGKLIQKLLKGGVPTKGEFKDLEAVFGWDLAEAITRHGTSAKVWRILGDITGLPKAIKATADLSYVLRQTIFAGVAEPKIWGKSFGTQVKSFLKQEWYDDAMLAIKANPEFEAGRKLGLEFTEIGKTLGRAEEAYPTRIADAIPILKQSNRAATIMSNKMRWDIFFKYRTQYAGMYGDTEWKAIVDILNTATGRGVVPRSLVPAFTIANRIFFSPRFAITPFQMAYFPFRHISNPVVRRFALRSWAGFIGTNVSLLSLGKLTGLWDVELDPTSSNFGRVRIGDTRFDLWHGYLPWVRLFSRIVKGTTKTETGEIVEIKEGGTYTRADIVAHTVRGKLDPITAAIWDLLEGRSYIGEEFPPAEEDVPQALKDRLLPMSVMDVWDAYISDGMAGATIGGIGATLGANVASYPARVFDEWADYISKQMRRDWDYGELRVIREDFNKHNASAEEYRNLPAGRIREKYLEEHPELEASLYFWGEKLSLSTEEAVNQAYAKIDSYGLPRDIFPMRDQEPYDFKGKEPIEMLGEYTNLMPKYISDYILQYKDTYLKSDLPYLITQIEEIRRYDDALINQYDALTEGKDDDVRRATREAYPTLDMALNFRWEITGVSSEEAMNMLRERFTEIGMPIELSPTYQRSLKEQEEAEKKEAKRKLIEENRIRKAQQRANQ